MIVKQPFMEPFISYGEHHPAVGKKHTHTIHQSLFSMSLVSFGQSYQQRCGCTHKHLCYLFEFKKNAWELQ